MNEMKEMPTIDVELEHNPDLIEMPATPVAHTVKRGRGRPAKVEKQLVLLCFRSKTLINHWFY